MTNGVDPPKSGVSSESNSSAPNWQTSMMNINSPEYQATLNKKTPQPVNTKVSAVGNTPTSIQASPVKGIHNIKASVDSWKSETAKEKARWNALTDDQKKEEVNKQNQETEAAMFKASQDALNKSYGGITTGAANIALGSGEEGEIAGGFLPGVGEAIDAKNTIQDLKEGDWGGAAMNAAGFLLPFVPGKAIKKFFRGAETPTPTMPSSSNRLPMSNKNTPNVSTTKPESSIFADGPRRYHNETGMEGIEIADMELNAMKKLGKQLDDEHGYFNYGDFTSDNAKFHGTVGGRPVAEVELPTGNTQMFYKSSGLAGKKGVGVGGTTEGLWQPYGGHVNMPNSQFGRGEGFNEQWFIKDGGYKDWYGSKSFKGISDNLDRIAQEGKWDMSDMLKASDQ